MCAESVTVQLFGVFKNGVSGKPLKKKHLKPSKFKLSREAGTDNQLHYSGGFMYNWVFFFLDQNILIQSLFYLTVASTAYTALYLLDAQSASWLHQN